MTDPFNLERFVTAEEPVFDTALSELRAGKKRTHWMWFIFPQRTKLPTSAGSNTPIEPNEVAKPVCRSRLRNGVGVEFEFQHNIGDADRDLAVPHDRETDRKFVDSPLEGSGFELSVPLLRQGSRMLAKGDA